MKNTYPAERQSTQLLPKVEVTTCESAKLRREHDLDYVEQQLGHMYRTNPSLFNSVTRMIVEIEPLPGTERTLLRDTAAETYHWLSLQSEMDMGFTELPQVSDQVCDGIEIARGFHRDFVDDNIDLLQKENPVLAVSANSYATIGLPQYYHHAEVVIAIYRALRNQAEIDSLNSLYNNSPSLPEHLL